MVLVFLAWETSGQEPGPAELFFLRLFPQKDVCL